MPLLCKGSHKKKSSITSQIGLSLSNTGRILVFLVGIVVVKPVPVLDSLGLRILSYGEVVRDVQVTDVVCGVAHSWPYEVDHGLVVHGRSRVPEMHANKINGN